MVEVEKMKPRHRVRNQLPLTLKGVARDQPYTFQKLLIFLSTSMCSSEISAATKIVADQKEIRATREGRKGVEKLLAAVGREE